MKRHRFPQEVGEVESINMANMLMFLSRGEGGVGGGNGDESDRNSRRVFECKTCGRRFPSFQALGGHRASHKKPRLSGDSAEVAKPRVHECSVCGLEFALGQALGGHMRRHRAVAAAAVAAEEEMEGCGSIRIVLESKHGREGKDEKRGSWLDLDLDLNMAPPTSSAEDDAGHRKISYDFMDKTPILVDFFH